MPLLVCRTCPRYEPDSGSFGTRFDQAVADVARDRGVRVRHVPCAGGCPQPGNIALDGPGKPRIRFSHITANDAGIAVEAARRYDESASGSPADWSVPVSLNDRITAVTPKGPATSA